MKLFIPIILSIAFAQVSLAQINTTPVSKKDIPATIKYEGQLVESVKYTDRDGEHLLITTETGRIGMDFDGKPNKKGYFSMADIYAYNYLVTGNTYKLSWQMHDFSGGCSDQSDANYIKGTFAVTDLNNDGVAEVWLMYMTGCRGDMYQTANLKVIMHEGTKKYAMRGHTRLNIKPRPPFGGDYKLDDAFKTGPVVFKEYAVKLWTKNMNEN